MKSLKSIAQQKGFELNKLTKLVEEVEGLSPMNMGSTLLYSNDDVKAIVSAYYDKFMSAQA